MSRYSKEDILRLVAEEDVEFVRLQFTDAFGILKNVAITSSQLKRALDNKIMFDGASIDGFVRIEESDMYLYPDLDSFTIFLGGHNRVRLQDLSATYISRMEHLLRETRDTF